MKVEYPSEAERKLNLHWGWDIFLKPIIAESGLRIIGWGHPKTLSSNKVSLPSWASAKR